MRKLLFIVNVDWFFISHRLPIAVEAIKNGYEVHLACSFIENKQQLIDLGLHVHDVDFSRSGNGIMNEVSTLRQVRATIKHIQPDIVHAITIKPVIYSGLALRTLFNKPAFVVAISGLGYVFSAQNVRAKIIKLFVSQLYHFALHHENKRIIFQNNSDEKILTDVANITSSQKVLIRGSGADLNHFSFKNEPDSPVIKVVMASRLLKEKGVYEFIAAAKLVRKKAVNIEFILIGAPDLDNPNSVTASEIENWHENGFINALGHRKDVHKIFSESHIVILPSYYGEGVPKVLIEAAACGRPIVTTDNPGCRDAVIPFVTGLLVPIKNAEKLAEAILKLVKNKEIRVDMGIKARQFAEREFDVKSVVKKHLEIYSDLIGNENGC